MSVGIYKPGWPYSPPFSPVSAEQCQLLRVSCPGEDEWSCRHSVETVQHSSWLRAESWNSNGSLRAMGGEHAVWEKWLFSFDCCILQWSWPWILGSCCPYHKARRFMPPCLPLLAAARDSHFYRQPGHLAVLWQWSGAAMASASPALASGLGKQIPTVASYCDIFLFCLLNLEFLYCSFSP